MSLIYDGSTPLKKPKDERFCQEWVASNNIQIGYERAGYKRPRGNAQRKAREPHVEARAAFLFNQAAKAASLMGGRLMIEAERIANANIFDFVDVDPVTKRPALNLAKVPHELGGVIQEFAYDANGKPKIKLHDKPGMLKFLIERASPTPQRHEHSGPNGAPIEVSETSSDLDFARRVAFVLARGANAAPAKQET